MVHINQTLRPNIFTYKHLVVEKTIETIYHLERIDGDRHSH